MSTCSAIFFLITITMALTGCNGKKNNTLQKRSGDITTIGPANGDTSKGSVTTNNEIPFEIIHPDSLVSFAKTLIGIPYLYASTDPLKGFDCSGFITYVFKHFNLLVPRSSVDFTQFGKEIDMEKANPGDLILFTGTDSSDFVVGHIGIVESTNNDTLRFIHSTSGKAKGVVISPLGDYYKKRFVKVIRVFPDEYFN